MPERSLVVDSRGVSGLHRVRSRSEALQQLTVEEYDTIELYTSRPGIDEYGLVAYLAGTWPTFLQRLTIRTTTPGRPASQWNHEQARFIVAVPPDRRRQRRRKRSQSAPASALAT